MTFTRHWKVALCLGAIFIAGGLTGAFITLGVVKHRIQKRNAPAQIMRNTMEKLKSRLNLTPEQIEKIRPIIAQAADRIKAVKTGAAGQNAEIINNTFEQIKKELTPEQLERFEKLEQARRKKFEASRFRNPQKE